MKNKLFSIFTALAMVLGILVSPFTSAHAADEENAAATVDKTTNIYLHKLLMTSQELKDWDSKAIEEKGYDATSIEEITATVGVAKGTLYYHFSSKEEIFNFLIEEGIKLLQNSIDIKTEKLDNYIDKIKAIVLIEIKIVNKYEDFITILLSQFYGKEARNKMCQQHVFEYIGKIEKIVAEGMKKGEIKQGDPKVIASEIYALIASTLVYKMKNGNEIDIIKTYKEFEKTLVEGLKAK